eukprot:GHUV01058791.1.p1 GENE.GHUV01058791.1~~GHUV01058791.1.p1  ORF type:complete len:117 (-),score=29.45 GHUV01058791.1:151-501(-)
MSATASVHGCKTCGLYVLLQSTQGRSLGASLKPSRSICLQAELADRDFTAERYQPVVVSTSAHTALAAEQSAAKRTEAEQRNAHKLHIPRRPEWDASTTPEQLDAQEKASFLDWRR